MFPLDPLKSVGFRIIWASMVVHGYCWFGLHAGSPVRHGVAVAAAVIWSAWMVFGQSKFAWVMNIIGMAVGALAFVISGVSLLSRSVNVGISMIVFGIVYADLCRRLCAREVSVNFE